MANDKAFKVKNTLELAGYNTSIASTAVDVFVYDTSKDSDGGAWRKRTQHTSWYNETLNTTTRGSRREFPAVAVIVAEATKVTIYDGDDPALPMWMVFNGGSNFFINTSSSGTVGSVSAVNAEIRIGQNVGGHGVREASFVSDKIVLRNATARYDASSVISGRNAVITVAATVSSAAIVNSTVNDVAMTVLPDAPIDPATGLPVPTIAVATNGGVSVIKDDGTVVDISFVGTRNYVSTVDFSADNWVFATTSNVTNPAAWFPVLFEIPSVDVANVGTTSGGNGVGFTFVDAPYINTTQYEAGTDAVASDQTLFLGKTVGFWQIPAVPDDTLAVMRKNMVSKITSTYNTGWMNGNIKGAFLSDTDTASLVANDKITNGDNEAAVFSGAAPTRATVSQTSEQANGGTYSAKATFSGGLASHYIAAVTIPAGEAVYVSFDVYIPAAYTGSGIKVIDTSDGSWSISTVNTRDTWVNVSGWRGAKATSWPIGIGQNTSENLDGQSVYIDNLSITALDADRSVNNKGLIVNGTVTRSPVATGAELMAYSGFSSSNYLEQPYNSALDFGTGDFCVMGWFKTNDNSTSSKQILERTDRHLGFTGGGQIAIEIDGTITAGAFECGITDDNWATVDTVRTSTVYDNNVWHYFAVVKSSGTLKAYIDGSLAASTTVTNAAGSLSNANAKLAVGARVDGTSPFNVTGSGLALLRISATAPTAEQIKKIYEDEKVLFQENAAATLYGTSDAVTALAHDEDTGLLHVGTSAGRSVFQGLRRVSNTTTAVGTAISASNGLVVEE